MLVIILHQMEEDSDTQFGRKPLPLVSCLCRQVDDTNFKLLVSGSRCQPHEAMNRMFRLNTDSQTPVEMFDLEIQQRERN